MSSPPDPPVLAIVGPTAAGKTALSLHIAPALGAEIVSLDSTMVYRGMDIATDKPSPEELATAPHHLVDVVDCSHSLSVAEFQTLARAAIADILGRGRVPLLVGGSGLYFRAVVDALDFPPTDPDVRGQLEGEAANGGQPALYARLQELDPVAASFIDPANARRTVRALEVIEITGRPFSSFKTAWDRPRSLYNLTVVGLRLPREELDRRIEARFERQLARGLVDEIQGLIARGLRQSTTAVQALGYAQVLAHLDGRCSVEEAGVEAKARTRRFARRQERWFRADPRVVWFDDDGAGAARQLAAAVGRNGEEGTAA